jgi:hypothetical protein
MLKSFQEKPLQQDMLATFKRSKSSNGRGNNLERKKPPQKFSTQIIVIM